MREQSWFFGQQITEVALLSGMQSDEFGQQNLLAAAGQRMLVIVEHVVSSRVYRARGRSGGIGVGL